MPNQRVQFLKRQFFGSAWNASVQRNNTYNANAYDGVKTRFKRAMEDYLMSMVDREYGNPISEDRHYENIRALMEHGAQAGHGILVNRVYRAANAQKLLNLYLKYLWCAGLVPRPPHCPVDSIVLRKAKIQDKKWTEMETLEDYRTIVERLMTAAGKLSLAEWELEVYQENA